MEGLLQQAVLNAMARPMDVRLTATSGKRDRIWRVEVCTNSFGGSEAAKLQEIAEGYDCTVEFCSREEKVVARFHRIQR